MGLKDQVRRLWKRRENPLNAIWKWATRPKKPGPKRNRFRTARAWAQDKVELGRKHKWPHKVVAAWVDRRNVYRKKQKFFAEKQDERAKKAAATPNSGVVAPDKPWNPYRKPVAAWMVPKIDAAWNRGWRGTLTSGYRSPAYSQQLCYSICGAPSCPGRCAGTASNHTQHVYPNGAIDVSNPSSFAAASRAAGTGLWNALGSADPWHFSMSGR